MMTPKSCKVQFEFLSREMMSFHYFEVAIIMNFRNGNFVRNKGFSYSLSQKRGTVLSQTADESKIYYSINMHSLRNIRKTSSRKSKTCQFW